MIAITFPLKTLIVRGLIRDVSMVQYDKANGEIHHKLIFNTNAKYPYQCQISVGYAKSCQ